MSSCVHVYVEPSQDGRVYLHTRVGAEEPVPLFKLSLSYIKAHFPSFENVISPDRS